jgi:hypothetical protein
MVLDNDLSDVSGHITGVSQGQVEKPTKGFVGEDLVRRPSQKRGRLWGNREKDFRPGISDAKRVKPKNFECEITDNEGRHYAFIRTERRSIFKIVLIEDDDGTTRKA